MRSGEVSLTAPFRYTAVLFAMLLGYAVWNEIPSGWAWLGIALLVGSGLYMLHSERGPNPRCGAGCSGGMRGKRR